MRQTLLPGAAAVLLLSACVGNQSSGPAGESRSTNLSREQTAANGRGLFLKNCAHCHGADARGDEGPDLHRLSKSDDWIVRPIRDGKKDEMTAFGGKLQPAEITALLNYLRGLR